MVFEQQQINSMTITIPAAWDMERGRETGAMKRSGDGDGGQVAKRAAMVRLNVGGRFFDTSTRLIVILHRAV